MAFLLLLSISLPPPSTAKYHQSYLSPTKAHFSRPSSPPNKIYSSPSKTAPPKADVLPPSPPRKTHFPQPSPRNTTAKNTRFSPPPPNCTSPKTHYSPATNTPPKARVSPASPPQPGTTLSVNLFLVGRSGRIVLGIIAATIVFLSLLIRKWCRRQPPAQSLPVQSHRPLYSTYLWGFITTSLPDES